MTAKRRRRIAAPAVVPSDAPPPRVSSAELIAWIERYCYITAPIPEPGNATIIPMALPPFMRHDLATIFDNPARTRRAIISMGRKGAKTTTAAAIALAAVAGPLARRGGQVFSSAWSRDQASLIFSAAARFVRLNPYLSRVVKIRETAKEIVCAELGTKVSSIERRCVEKPRPRSEFDYS